MERSHLRDSSLDIMIQLKWVLNGLDMIVCVCKILVSTYKSTQHYNPEEYHHSYCLEVSGHLRASSLFRFKERTSELGEETV